MVGMNIDKKAIFKNKLIYLVCTCSILLLLIGVYYYFFFHIIKVDMNTIMQLSFEGESGNATAYVTTVDNYYNQRIQPFFDSLTYTVEPSTQLKNGDQVTVTLHYDQEQASKYHIEVSSTTETLVVDGLAERYKDIEEIPETFISQLNSQGNTYIEKNRQAILESTFSHFKKKTVVYQSHNLLHRAFLKAEQIEHKDKIVEVYEIYASGIVQDSEEERLDSCYYMVVYDDIHKMQLLDAQNIYGEPVIEDKTNLDSNQFIKLLRAKYLLSYEIMLF